MLGYCLMACVVSEGRLVVNTAVPKIFVYATSEQRLCQDQIKVGATSGSYETMLSA